MCRTKQWMATREVRRRQEIVGRQHGAAVAEDVIDDRKQLFRVPGDALEGRREKQIEFSLLDLSEHVCKESVYPRIDAALNHRMPLNDPGSSGKVHPFGIAVW